MKFYKVVGMIMVGILLLGSAYQYRSSKLQEEIADKVLRFHVIANSDSEADQALKLKVRDGIGNYLHKELQAADNLEESIEIINKNMDDITACAERVIASEGYDYSVQSKVAWVDFPVKTYGEYAFPKGNYQALKVVIGNGTGKNWWCVMYPNMCFSNSMYEVVDENSKEELQKVLTQEEYTEVVAEGKVQVKLKYLEKCKEFFSQLEK